MSPQSLQHLEGSRYGPVALRISSEKVSEYVMATGDDADRWARHAPPSFAAALLFSIAPSFLWSEEVGRFATVLVHSDQLFRWHGPLQIDLPVTVGANVARVRARGAMNFVTLELQVDRDSGARLVESVSTFLMGTEPSSELASPLVEPPVRARASNDTARLADGEPPTLRKSASREDLVRYAAASGDFNPVHYDHDAARAAGLPGIVVHGLLMAAWLTQVAGGVSTRPDPIAELKIRFRNALAPAAAAVASGSYRDATDRTRMDLALESDGVGLVTGSAVLRDG